MLLLTKQKNKQFVTKMTIKIYISFITGALFEGIC